MLVTNKNIPKCYLKLSIILNAYNLEHAKSMHYLGVDVDENLTSEVNVKSLTPTFDKASKFMN